MTPDPTPGLLLAGGLARRMGGGDKPMKTIGGRTILDRVIARIAPQCDGLILNANGDPQRFAAFGLSVVADSVEDFPGPLAGILAGLDWISAHRPDVTWMLSAAADCPFLPRDLVTQLHNRVHTATGSHTTARSEDYLALQADIPTPQGPLHLICLPIQADNQFIAGLCLIQPSVAAFPLMGDVAGLPDADPVAGSATVTAPESGVS